jgi:hypothetical protein
MSSDPYIRVVGQVDQDGDGPPLTVGVDYDAVTIDGRRLDSYQAAEFAAVYVSACIEAARQAGTLTDAARAELRAAAAEMGLAEVGGNLHDQAYSNHAGRNPAL